MEELFKKLKTLKSISSTNDKKRFIKANENDLLFKTTLKFLLDDMQVTNISKAKINKKVKIKPNEEIINMYDLYNYLSHDCGGKDIDLANVQAFISEHKEFETELKEIITKSMRLGVKAKLVNQALGYNLIPIFDVQLATSYDKCKNKFKGKEIIITEKIDGQKMIAIKENNKVKLYSRQGKILDGLIEIEKDILSINKESFVMDGELVSANEFNNNEDTYKDTMKKASKKGIKTGLVYMIYDYIENVDDFYRGRDNTKSIDRKANVKRIIDENNLKFIKYLEPWYIGEDLNKVEEFLLKADNNGKEGICVNIADAPYEAKRTHNLAKCKSFKTADVLVYDIVEGEGAMKDMLGALKCKFIYNGEIQEVEVGSGFKQSERIEIYNNPSLVLNKIITIRMFEISKNSSTNKFSLRFPSWISMNYIRKDKISINDTSVD